MITEWQDSNAGRAYPFAERSHLTDATGTYTLPDDAITEVRHVGLDLNAAQASIATVHVAASQYTIEFTIQGLYTPDPTDEAPEESPDEEELEVTTEIVIPASAVAGQTYVLSNAQGHTRVTVGPGIHKLGEWAVGSYVFSDALLEPRVFSLFGQLRLTSISGMTGSTKVDGDVFFHAGHSIRIRATGDRLLFDAIAGAGEGFPCVRTPDTSEDCSHLVQYINGAIGGSDGVFDLLGGKGVRVVADPDNHTIILEIDSPEERLDC